MFHGETGMMALPGNPRRVDVPRSRKNDAGAFAVPASNLYSFPGTEDDDERGLRRCQLFVLHNFCFSLGLTFGSSIFIGDTYLYSRKWIL